MTGRVLAGLLAVSLGITACGSSSPSADRAVCRAVQGLNGHSIQPTVNDAIHLAGTQDHDHLGSIARKADGVSWPGHLSLVSEDYSYVTGTCSTLGLPVPNAD